MSNRCYCKDNRGYSMIELIIVLAIIAVIMGTVFYSIILVFSANARSCANDIQRSIGDCKVTTMGKSSAYMTLYRDSTNENVYTQMHVQDSGGSYPYPAYGDAQKVGTQKVSVKYKSDTGTETELLAGDEIEIWFDRATGGFLDDGTRTLYEYIRVEGGSKNYKIVLTKLTGKSEVVPEAPTP
ncbi:MAG: prepilin-type N-terminal cleavage/methylation domain-containing protein [Lachnospiraceae bacterium]|nr:prepilin-type N-terminal cleavage/methylation domain-containing protein [Lachnospiraceae bacterium]